MMIIILLFTFKFFSKPDSLKLPSWFYKTPENAIVVIIPDQFDQSAKAYALYKEVNHLIAVRENPVIVKGYSGAERDRGSRQVDKSSVEWEVSGETRNYLEIFNYNLVDYRRYPYKMIIALFAKDDISNIAADFIMDKPNWVDEGYGKEYAVGFGHGNVNFARNWVDAYEHALFNLSMAHNNKNISEKIYLKKSNEKKYDDGLYSVSLNFVESIFNGVLITERWYNPEDASCYVRIKKRY